MRGVRKKMWLALASAAFLAAVLGVACSSGDEPASTPSVEPPPAGGAVTEDDFVSLFNAINIQLLDDTRVLNQIAVNVSIDDQARFDSEETTRLILDNFNGELDLVEMLEPVPESVSEALESTKAALMKYIAAATLLLPPQASDREAFDFSEYQMLMSEAGEAFHGAGFALPMDSAFEEEGAP